MSEFFSYVDVSLPVPLTRAFTYAVPQTLRHRVAAGCRIVVPFGTRKLTGVILKVHNTAPEVETREALRLLDAEPVFDAQLLGLARWVAEYYCAPLGEVLRAMALLTGEMRRSKTWALTDRGHEVARQLFIGDVAEDPSVELMRALEQRELGEATLERKIPGSRKLLKALEKKGYVAQEQELAERDPLRAPAARLRVEFLARELAARVGPLPDGRGSETDASASEGEASGCPLPDGRGSETDASASEGEASECPLLDGRGSETDASASEGEASECPLPDGRGSETARSETEFAEAEVVAREKGKKLPKAQRELLAYLELHPGTHNLEALAPLVKGASQAARALARIALVRLSTEAPGGGDTSWARPRHALNPHQTAAVEQIGIEVAARRFQTFLLHGVTGSGKTEVYLNAIEAALEAGRGALMLVPEIALTPSVAGQFQARFGDRVAILHSAFNDSERAQQWRRLRAGEAMVAVGTRSAVFAPVRELGLIVVDEEHDGSYKQDETPRYNGRDVAILRAREESACVVLGSATPSLESRYNVERGKSRLLELPERVGERAMPTVELVDMREEFLDTGQQTLFSRRLVEEVQGKLAAGEQTILLMNRRGFSSSVACRSCGERIECANCALALTFHKRDHRLLCHYCGYAIRVPKECPQCGSEHLYFLGSGSEKVEEELHRHFGAARIARLDRDTVTGKHKYEEILGGFREGAYDILVGTQMIAKGHDIPNVTLVGVINADIGLGVPDFRAAERTFQLLTQVAGRAGRHELSGTVLVQTTNPDHYSIRCAAEQDYSKFYEKELEFRRLMRYPPFSALANVLVRATRQEEALEMSGGLAELLHQPGEGLKLLGPAEAPVPRLKSEFRYQMLIKSRSRPRLNETLQRVQRYALERKWPATALVVDVDPLNLT
jgi:primosomal protein N' (replication factor Y)